MYNFFFLWGWGVDIILPTTDDPILFYFFPISTGSNL